VTGDARLLRRLWLAVFLLFAAVAHGNFETEDAGFTMQAARSLWRRGDSGLLRADQGGDSLGEALGAAYIRKQGTCGKLGGNGVAYTWFPIGHVYLFVPVVAVGEALAGPSRAADEAFRRAVAPGLVGDQLAGSPSFVRGTPVLTQGLIALLVPATFAACSAALLFLLARALGSSPRAAVGVALAVLVATQASAFGREQLSDGPGLAFLLAALLAVVVVDQGRGTARTALLGGLCGGAAVLLRYQNAALLVALGLALLIACVRQRRLGLVAVFTLGVVPSAALLLAVDFARFGDPFDTGYPKTADWLDQPIWLGSAKILFGAGRGAMWFSPVLWLALPAALRAATTPRLRWLAWALFLFPLLFFAQARGWQGGQCWAARYQTHGLVALLALVLPQAQPWRRWPKAWWATVVCGVFVTVSSVVAPVRGVLQLGAQAVAAVGTPGKPDDLTGWQPRYTPLLANWRYALADATGLFEFDDAAWQANSIASDPIVAVFGVDPQTAEQRLPPQRWEDRRFRHLWWRFWADLTGVPSWALLAPVALALAVALARLATASRPAPSDSSTTR
jgi:hypothetical protein